jgi:hypothetical protein
MSHPEKRLGRIENIRGPAFASAQRTSVGSRPDTVARLLSKYDPFVAENFVIPPY